MWGLAASSNQCLMSGCCFDDVSSDHYVDWLSDVSKEGSAIDARVGSPSID